MPPWSPAALRSSRWRRVCSNGVAGATPTASSPAARPIPHSSSAYATPPCWHLRRALPRSRRLGGFTRLCRAPGRLARRSLLLGRLLGARPPGRGGLGDLLFDDGPGTEAAPASLFHERRLRREPVGRDEVALVQVDLPLRGLAAAAGHVLEAYDPHALHDM